VGGFGQVKELLASKKGRTLKRGGERGRSAHRRNGIEYKTQETETKSRIEEFTRTKRKKRSLRFTKGATTKRGEGKKPQETERKRHGRPQLHKM